MLAGHKVAMLGSKPPRGTRRSTTYAWHGGEATGAQHQADVQLQESLRRRCCGGAGWASAADQQRLLSGWRQ